MGNYLLDAEELGAARRGDNLHLETTVSRVLQEKNWNGAEAILSVAWLDTRCSPSTQCWIPPLGEGKPFVDGVYEQLLIGPEKVFLGSVPARLDDAHVDWMVKASQLIINGYQQLAMWEDAPSILSSMRAPPVECTQVGGDIHSNAVVDWIVPGSRPAIVRETMSDTLKGVAFTELHLLGFALRPTYRERTFVVYNVGCLNRLESSMSSR